MGLMVVLVLAGAMVSAAQAHSGRTLRGNHHAKRHARTAAHEGPIKKQQQQVLVDADASFPGTTLMMEQLRVLAGTASATSQTFDALIEAGTLSTAAVVDGSTQLVWTSSASAESSLSSSLPHSIRLDARHGKDGLGTTLVFDVSAWAASAPTEYEAWVAQYTALSTDQPSRTDPTFRLAVRTAPATTPDAAISATVEFATGPEVGNPSTEVCSAFSDAVAAQDIAAAVAAANSFLAIATSDLPSTTSDAVRTLFASGSVLSSHSVRTNCFWVDSYLGETPPATVTTATSASTTPGADAPLPPPPVATSARAN